MEAFLSKTPIKKPWVLLTIPPSSFSKAYIGALGLGAAFLLVRTDWVGASLPRDRSCMFGDGNKKALYSFPIYRNRS